MRTQWFGVAGVLAIAVAIVGYKTDTFSRLTTKAGSAAAEPARVAFPSVVLVADLSEADDPCVCGEIIRGVRKVAAKGVSTKEIDPAKSPDVAASFKVRVAPTVLLFDDRGREVRRFEGESGEILAALESALSLLPVKPR